MTTSLNAAKRILTSNATAVKIPTVRTNLSCSTRPNKGRLPEIKEQIIDMALSGSGIRDTARVLGVSTDTVINELKKKSPH